MIKYRAWDTVQKKYIDSDDASISGNGILTVVGIEGKYHMSVQPPNDLAPRFIIEQYTGLEDECGVEIYEGDIVKFTTAPDYDGESLPGVGQVSIENGCSCVDGPDRSELLFVAAPIEVIGNIHENSELLGAGDKNVPSKKG